MAGNNRKIFISYSHQDEKWKDQLETQLGVLEMQGELEAWNDRRIQVGKDWLPEIEKALNEASIAILLISANFLTSEFIIGNEVPRLLERREKEGIWLIPIIVRPCAWTEISWLRSIQCYPKNGDPLAGKNENDIDTELANLTTVISKYFGKTVSSPKPATASKKNGPEKITIGRLPNTGSALFGREKELQLLDDAWTDESTHFLSLVAWGGVGKTALVKAWLNNMQQDKYRGAQRVYAWSFYSQGVSERQASADLFINDALEWFGDENPEKGDPWEKGRRLADFIRQRKTLLILDGLEPLQYPPGPLQGEVKDPALKTLLKELSGANDGLCLITTREAVKELEHKAGGAVQRIFLEHLPKAAGAQLLKNLKVNGSKKELETASGEFKGHALALTLLGSYLATVHEGDIRKRDLIPNLSEEPEKGGHARRVMESYEIWLKDKPELDILYLLGLFDRPAPGGAIAALRAEPPIPGLTEAINKLSDVKWKYALKQLRVLRLLAAKDPARPDILDCHPLLREHFGEKLEKEKPKAWKAAHSRLYEYYKNLPEKELPDTLEEMEPLFAAVAHGCRAGNHQEVLDDVYWERIRRKKEAYTVHKLGAFGADLAALANFFTEPWREPAAGLTDADKAVTLSWAGFRLRALGRLQEAAQPMRASFELAKQQKEWKAAAMRASNLSELYLTLGEVAQAVTVARESVDFAERSGDEFERVSNRTTLANALHHSGEAAEAETLFQEAEALQRERQPDYPYLYSLRGFQFCDLLLSRGAYLEVLNRVEKFFEWRLPSDPLLTIALEYLSAGRAHWQQADDPANPLDTRRESIRQAENYLDQSVAGLRKAGTQDHLPRGLLAKAAFYREQEDFVIARRDLQEAREIAERGDMRLFLADYYLESCRRKLAELGSRISDFGIGKDAGEAPKIPKPAFRNPKFKTAREDFEIAAKMVEEMGYGRRKPEVEALREIFEGMEGEK